MQDLLSGLPNTRTQEPIGEGAMLLRGFAAAQGPELLRAVEQVCAAAPFRHLTTPGGYLMSVAMTNCGNLGWMSDRRGYRYQHIDPSSGNPWPPMPPPFRVIATDAAAEAGYACFVADACLINHY